MEIYLVSGTTGEYSDRSIWRVKAFGNEQEANAYTAKLNELAKAHFEQERELEYYGEAFYDNKGPLREQIEAMDPEFESQYTGTEYETTAVPFVEASRLEPAVVTTITN